ncbi:MAG: hypothetical protein ABH867_04465 [Patescibacteria group bacterium]
MIFQDVKPTSFSDPANDWQNEANAYDGNLATFADNQPDQTLPQNLDFSGQTISLGANEAIFGVRLTLKLGSSGFQNDFWEVMLINGATNRRLWTGIVIITDPTTFEWEVLPNILTNDGLWTKADFENLILRIGPVYQSGKADTVLIKAYDITYRVFTHNTQTQSLLTVYSTPALDGDITDNPPVDGQGNAVDNTFSNFWVGDRSTNGAWRGFVSFPITVLPANAVIDDATIDFVLDFSYGDGLSGDTQIPSGLGGCRVDHVDFGSSLDPADYQTTPFVSNIGTLVFAEEYLQGYHDFTTPDTWRWRGIDNLSLYIQNDYDAGRGRSQFRIRWDNPTDNDGKHDHLAIVSADLADTPSRYHPRLRIVYHIEEAPPEWTRPYGFYDYMALKVRGKLGDIATFQEQWWGRQVSPPFYPYNPQTYYQQSWRSVFAQGVANWQGFDEVVKQEYKSKSKNLLMTGFNYYLSEYLKANYPPW